MKAAGIDQSLKSTGIKRVVGIKDRDPFTLG
jgi:hypothetical protein